MVTNTSFTELDFFENKAALIEYLKQQDRFRDYDFTGSNLNVLLDVLAYNTQLNNYYVHAALSENFLDTAQLRESVNSHAKELNYLPRSRSSSTATLDVYLTVPPSQTPPSFLSIPKNTLFSGVCEGITFSFYNEEAVTVQPVDGVYQYSGLKVFEGSFATENYVVDDVNPKRIVLNSNNVDTSSIKVFVRDGNDLTLDPVEYVFKQDTFGVDVTDSVFYIQASGQFKYEVYFGKNILGNEPKHSDIITVQYRKTEGESANGVRRFTPPSKINGYPSTVFVASMSEGGAERESIEDIRFSAPKYAQVQQRAVTESDYGILLKSEFSEIQSISVYGGEKADPPLYGRVVIAVDIENADGLTLTAKEKFYNFIKTRTPLAIEPVITAAQFMYVEVVSDVVYNTAFTSKSSSDIQTAVAGAITTYTEESLDNFGVTLRFSKMSKNIDASDTYIVSNDTKIRAIIEFTPIVNFTETFTIKFNNELEYDHGAFLSDDIHYPALKSSEFIYSSQTCFIMDDGLGFLHIYRESGTNLTKIVNKIGTVDYTTGEVVVKNFSVESFTGSAIKFYANLVKLDLVAPDTRVMSIRPEDVTITITSVRE